jgi:hypothetical protein
MPPGELSCSVKHASHATNVVDKHAKTRQTRPGSQNLLPLCNCQHRRGTDALHLSHYTVEIVRARELPAIHGEIATCLVNK